ncbi:MAG: hypothetical protein U0941_18090 [Planctomycetaceae bacterium]
MAVRTSVVAFVMGIVATGMAFADDAEKPRPLVSTPSKKSDTETSPPQSVASPAYTTPSVKVGTRVAPNMPIAPVSPSIATASPADSSPSVSKALSRSRRQRRQNWERLLQEPAKISIDNQKSITLGAFLDQVRRQHGLNVQIDMQNVIPLAGTLKLGEQVTTGQAAKLAMPNRKAVAQELSTLPSKSAWGYAASPSAYLIPAEARVEAELKSEVAPVEDLNADEPSKDGPSPAPSKNGLAKKKGKPKTNQSGKGESQKETEPAKEPALGSPEVVAEMKTFLEIPIDVSLVTRSDSTLEEVLQIAMNQAFPIQTMFNFWMTADESALPMSLTQAMEWELLVQDHGVLITTRLNANLQKETRVYSIRALEGSMNLKSEDVARLVTRTVRPWSWKKHFPDANAASSVSPSKSKPSLPKKITLPKVDLSLLGMLLSSTAANRSVIRLTRSEETTSGQQTDKTELTEEDMALLAQMWESLFQGSISIIQVIYHADPPSGVIEVHPGLLIISQSQGAHREIADLLEQLQNPEN